MDAMPRPRPQYLQKSTSRHGKVVWYVRVGRGPKIRIRGEYGGDEFNAAYRAAVSGDKPAKPEVAARDTVSWLIDLHRKSGYWSGLAAGTRKQRESIYRQVEATSGKYKVSSIDKQAVINGRDKRRGAPSQARNFVNAMRALFKWALESGLVKSDPTANIVVKKPRTAGIKPWMDEDIANYEAKWPRGTRERVMFDVFVYTGLRIGDAAIVGPKHVHNGVIMLATEKNDTAVTLPILRPLLETLHAGPIGKETFIASKTGRPILKNSLDAIFRKACRAAGVNKSAHGIRKAAATHAADQGATVHELEAIFGWSGGQMAAYYTKEANRKKLAKGAMGKLDRTQGVAAMLPPPKKVVAPEPEN
jgi:integrase